MMERPILFSAPMVRAILDGRKTQTRRVVKPTKDRNWGCELARHELAGEINRGDYTNSRYGQPGDLLWVRETFKPIASGEIKAGYGEVRYGYAYHADGVTQWNDRTTKIHELPGQPPSGPMQFQQRPWTRSIHMPRRASRILLRITDIRVERLQAVSGPDCWAEGIEHAGWDCEKYGSVTHCYRDLWESINGAGSWDENPWVWVIEFERVKP